MTSISRLVLSTALLAIAPAAIANAADYDPPIYVEEAPEMVPVEVGSGWYLRGDISYNVKRTFKDTLTSVSQPVLIDPFIDIGALFPMQNLTYSEKEMPVHASVGFGYHFNDYLRFDATIGKFGDQKFDFAGVIPNDISNNTGCAGTFVSRIQTLDNLGNPVGVVDFESGDAVLPCTGTGNVLNSAWNGMANAYVDLGTYVGITPYIGGGAGLYYAKSQVSATVLCDGTEETVLVPGSRTETTYLCDGQTAIGDPAVSGAVNYSNRTYDFMYQLSGGLSYQVSKNASVDLGYQYMSVPNTQYYTVGANGVEAHRGIDFHQIKLGFRYDLW